MRTPTELLPCLIGESRPANSALEERGDTDVKFWIVAAALFCVPLCASAQRKACEDLKSEIAKKIDAKGVSNYTLTIVDKGKETDGKIVGSCDGGTKSIVYQRGTPAAPVADAKAKPAADKKGQ